jgi:CSLREA domain-containing protein
MYCRLQLPVLVALAVLTISAQARADILFDVTTPADFADPDLSDGICGYRAPTRDFCSLRAAIQEANAHPGESYEIALPSGVYDILLRGRNEDSAATGDLDIVGNVILLGDGVPRGWCPRTGPRGVIFDVPLFDGCAGSERPGTIVHGRGRDRVFDVQLGGRLSLNHLAVRGGDPIDSLAPAETVFAGGGIRNEGSLRLHNVAVVHNRSERGGGISNAGRMELSEISVLRNAAEDGCGGGIENAGVMDLGDAIVGGNDAGTGGGLCLTTTDATLAGEFMSSSSIYFTTVSNNRAARGGGGVFVTDATTHARRPILAVTTIIGNVAPDGGGVLVRRAGEIVPDHGGPIFEYAWIVDNRALARAQGPRTSPGGRGGGIYSDTNVFLGATAIRANASTNSGGGIAAEGGEMIVVFGEISHNHSRNGAGVYTRDTFTGVHTTTVSSNVASERGGGLFVESTVPRAARLPLLLQAATVAANHARAGAAIRARNVTATIQRTIVASGGLENCRFDGVTLAETTSEDVVGSNLEDRNDCRFRTAAFTSTDPVLGTLADNGGPTLTHALLPGSPAIDVVPSCAGFPMGADLPMVDQRGVERPQGALCDIGAYEVAQVSPWLVFCCLDVFLQASGSAAMMMTASAEFRKAAAEAKHQASEALALQLLDRSKGLRAALAAMRDAPDRQSGVEAFAKAAGGFKAVLDTLAALEACCGQSIAANPVRLVRRLADDLAGRLAALGAAIGPGGPNDNPQQ